METQPATPGPQRTAVPVDDQRSAQTKRATPEWDKAFEQELADIRRRGAGGGSPAPDNLRDNLVGLAFSGGGIRSATFGLGVLEALRDKGLLPKVHYLSTVSGGGYIGAWLSAKCKRTPGWLESTADWSTSISHLRRYSNYLSPEVGFFSADTWSMLTIWFRNALLVQLTVILAVSAVLTAPRLLVYPFQQWPDRGNLRLISILLFIFAVAGIAGNVTRVSCARDIAFLKAESWKRGLGLSAICVAIVSGLWLAFDFQPFTNREVQLLPSLLIGFLMVLAGFCLIPVFVQIVALSKFGSKEAPTQLNYTQGYAQACVVLPIMVSGFLTGAILWGETTRVSGLARLDSYGGFFTQAWRYWPFPLAVVFCSLFLLSFCTVLVFEIPQDSLRRRLSSLHTEIWTAKTAKGLGAALLSAVVCMTALHALLCAIMLLLHGWRQNGGGLERAFIWAPTMVLFAFALTIILLMGMMSRQWTEGVREWWSRLGAWLSIYGSAWMLIAIVAIYGPQWISTLFRDYQAASWTGFAGWVGTVAAGLFAGRSDSTGGQTSANASRPNRFLQLIAIVAPYVFIAALLVGVATAIDYIVADNANNQTLQSIGLTTSVQYRDRFFLVSLIVFLGSVLALLLMAFRIDINEFSLSAFYRNRLVRCYLGATREQRDPQYFTGFDDKDDLPLASLVDGALPSTGPLHIVNCALNLGGSSDLALHTRHSASFTLSPLQCGSGYESRMRWGTEREIGYVPTSGYGGKSGAPTLGQAISVSGAAASPNMGYHTSPVVAFLLTVFNVRLGWWFPNPRPGGEEDARPVARPSPHINLSCLFAELFGLADDKSNFLMISDGGHFENLAVYELVRRRCKVIFVSDAECDPQLTFEGLGTLIRMCDVDFGAKIDLDVGSIGLAASSPWSTNRCAVGTVTYADRSQGIIVYFKASMTGHEDSATLQYKASHPAFPHESTGDQFYREDQFESYRRLGRDVALRTLETVIREDLRLDTMSDVAKDPITMDGLARRLRITCSPSLARIGRFTEHTERLMRLWELVGSNAKLANLDQGIVGSALPSDWGTAFRSEFYMCAEMLQLMENVYLDLSLDETWQHADNRGWQKMFLSWAESPSMQRTWQLSHKMFGLRFQYFCQRRLGWSVES